VFAYLAKGIKELVDVPVISGHRINDPNTARELITDGMCDMVAMGRPLIADPYLPQKAKNSREQEILHCIACAQGCFDNLFKLKPVECLCNPKAGRERETAVEKTRAPLKVMVIGGGAAGMSAALSAHEKGHHVSLYEKSDHLGGQLYIASAPPGREEFAELAKDLESQVVRSPINVFTNRHVDEALIEKEKPDAVILAIVMLMKPLSKRKPRMPSFWPPERCPSHRQFPAWSFPRWSRLGTFCRITSPPVNGW
jgi:2,4-dienoyl-CoA reductase (NADPH2)